MSQQQLRKEFVNTMLRTKSKAQRDAVISTGLMPVAYGIDILATLVWPFGGLGEIDTVWAYANIRGAKTARSVTKRLGPHHEAGAQATPDPNSDVKQPNTLSPDAALVGHTTPTPPQQPNPTAADESDKLRPTFRASPRIEVLRRYLDAECTKSDSKLFPTYATAPTESDVLDAIGSAPHQSGGEERNWEDGQWERTEVKDDLRSMMHKGAKEWAGWVKKWEKDPQKAMKK